MAIEVFNRYEVKYMLTQEQYQALLKIIERHMDCDPYNKGGKTYSICNLYLDTKNDELISRSLDKPIYKEKLRLRSYGKADLDSIVYLEIKKKFKGIVNKRRTPFILKEAYDFISNGTLPTYEKTNWQVLSEISYMQKRYNAKPKVFISYDRFAFFEKNNSDFRLTLDTNIQTRRFNVRLDEDIYGAQLLPNGMWLMEAKAFKAFPLWFCNFLAENKIYSTSFSKYGTEYKKYIAHKDARKKKEVIKISPTETSVPSVELSVANL